MSFREGLFIDDVPPVGGSPGWDTNAIDSQSPASKRRQHQPVSEAVIANGGESPIRSGAGTGRTNGSNPGSNQRLTNRPWGVLTFVTMCRCVSMGMIGSLQ